MHGYFVLVFYHNVTVQIIFAKVTIQTCVGPIGVKNENVLHQVGMFTQVSVFGVCRFGN